MFTPPTSGVNSSFEKISQSVLVAFQWSLNIVFMAFFFAFKRHYVKVRFPVKDHIYKQLQIISNAKITGSYIMLFPSYLQIFRTAPTSIIGGQIFIHSCSAQLISFEMDCFYGLLTRIYEYLPAPHPHLIIELGKTLQVLLLLMYI